LYNLMQQLRGHFKKYQFSPAKQTYFIIALKNDTPFLTVFILHQNTGTVL
jgi:hypothetical protein